MILMTQKSILPCLLLLLLLQLFGACRRTYTYPQDLTLIDSLTEYSPDRALTMLRRLSPSIDKRPDHEQMFCRLLALKAKSYAYQSLANDTLVTELVDYYEHQGDRHLLPQAYYYAGKVYRQRLNIPQAMEYFQKTIKSCGDEDLKTKSQAYCQLNYLYDQQWLDEDALEMCRAAYAISRVLKDTTFMTFELRDMGSLLYDLGWHDSAYIYYTSALQLAQKQNNKNMEADVSGQIAKYYNNEKKYNLAKVYIQKALNYNDPNNSSSILCIAADTYNGLGLKDSAIVCYHSLLEKGNVYTKKEAFLELYKFYANQKQFKEEQYFFNEYIKYADSIQNIRITDIVKQKKNFYEYNQKEEKIRTLEAQNKYKTLYICILVSVLIISAISFVFSLLHKQQRKKLQKVQWDKTKMLIERKENNISQYREFEKTEIYKKIKDLLNSNRRKNLSEGDWKELSEEVNKYWPQFEERLNQLCKMNVHDYHVCLLLKIKLPIKDIAELMNKTNSGIGSVRTKLYLRAFGEKKGVAGWDAVIDSL